MSRLHEVSSCAGTVLHQPVRPRSLAIGKPDAYPRGDGGLKAYITPLLFFCLGHGRRARAAPGFKCRHARPCLEALECRDLPSTLPLTVPGTTPADAATQAQVSATLAQVPLGFEANQGQTAAVVDFLARGSGSTLFLTPGGATLSLQPAQGAGAVLQLQVVGANPAVHGTGQDLLPGTTNSFVGNNPSQWQTGIATYGQVTYRDVYPGIDLVYHGNQQQLEYDFLIAPVADPGTIRLQFAGDQGLDLDAQGDLVLHTAGGDVVEQAPAVYQEIGGVRQDVAGRFVLEGNGQVGFAVAAYDPSQPLVIDPVLSYSTYLGGSGNDAATAIAVDAGGNVYITGETPSTNFPTTSGAYQKQLGGATAENAFVAKLNPALTGTASLVYSTYLGGSGTDIGTGIAVDASGAAYVTGSTTSPNFPTLGAYQSSRAGATNAFVTALNPAGTTLLYSSYLGGSGTDQANAIALDANADVYLTGQTTSTNFPITSGAFQGQLGSTGVAVENAFVAKLNPTLTGTASLVYSTYLGGSGTDAGNGIAVDSAGDAYVTGGTDSSDFPTTAALQPTYGGGSVDAFVAELNSTGSALVYATYLGGNGSDEGDGIAVDTNGNAYVTGGTASTNFPTTSSAYEAQLGGGGTASFNGFVAELSSGGSTLVYSTYLGGSGSDMGEAIALDASDNVYVTGYTTSANFPIVNPVQATLGGSGAQNVFVAELSTHLTGATSLLFSTYLGGSKVDAGYGIAVDASGNVDVAGSTQSTDFPTANAAQAQNNGGKDAFIAKIAGNPAPTLTSISPTAVRVGSANTTLTLSGTNFLASSTVTLNGTALATTFVSATQLTALVPAADLTLPGTKTITVVTQGPGGGPSTPQVFTIAAITSLVGQTAQSGQWWVAKSNGSSAFTNVLAGTWSPTWVDVQTGDFNGDGFTDLVGMNLQTGQWLVGLSDGAGHFTTTVWSQWDPSVTWVDVKVGDLNGDGKADLIGRDSQSGQWWAALSNGSSFTNALWDTWSPAVTWVDVQIGDLNGDGKADLIGRYLQTGQWWAALSNGSGMTNALWDTWNPAVTWVDVQIGDLNGDGKADLIGRYLQTGQWWAALSNGSGLTNVLWDTWNPGVTWVDVHLADLNGDGKADLIGRYLQTGQWWAALSTGSGITNSLWATWSPAATWVDVQVGDFNGDGKMDIAGMESDNGQWWVGLSSGTSLSTSRWDTWSTAVTWVDVNHGRFA
jgi:FG-GAP-like repeat/IPT/TIG domain/Beta-propeller repeat